MNQALTGSLPMEPTAVMMFGASLVFPWQLYVPQDGLSLEETALDLCHRSPELFGSGALGLRGCPGEGVEGPPVHRQP